MSCGGVLEEANQKQANVKTRYFKGAEDQTHENSIRTLSVRLGLLDGYLSGSLGSALSL